MAILIFIIILSVLVMIHELGHFLAAKRAKIGVEEFGFGLPPRIWGKKIGETIYSVNWLPFGGFVKLVGEDSTDKKKDAKNSFYVKSLLNRIIVVIAGVFMNLVLAIVIFYIVIVALGFRVSLPLLIDHKFKFVNETNQVLVADVASNSAAEKAGLLMGDSIVAVDGVRVHSISDLQKIIRTSENKQINLLVENPVNNQRKNITATPTFNEEIKAPALGVGLGELVVLNYSTPVQKVFSGFIHSFNVMDYSLRVFGKLIGYAISERDIRPVSEGVSGPVGIAALTSEAVHLGAITTLQLVGLLSLNLAFMNVLPIPALDGGRLFFLIIEAITRKKIYPNVEKWAHSIGFAILLGLIFLVTFNDIIKLIK